MELTTLSLPELNIIFIVLGILSGLFFNHYEVVREGISILESTENIMTYIFLAFLHILAGGFAGFGIINILYVAYYVFIDLYLFIISLSIKTIFISSFIAGIIVLLFAVVHHLGEKHSKTTKV